MSSCAKIAVEDGEKIEAIFLKTVTGTKNSKSATILIHSDKLKLHVKSAAGFIEIEKNKIPITPDQPFHVASIGKVFTSVLIFNLIETGKLSLNDSVKKILGSEMLEHLYVYEGIDLSDKVTVSHLLSHTSGVDDYFESVDQKGKSVLKEITLEPNKFWTPKELLDFTRSNQKAVSRPGEKFHYSDSGYILLGLVIEKISGKSFESNLQEKIFFPLGMKKSYMHLRSEPLDKPSTPISTMMLGDTDVTNFKSISADWSGGGIISTTEDLLIFQQALIKGKLVSDKHYQSMKGSLKFMSGIYYGKGLMTVRFGDMSFFMPKTPDLHGHSGLLSTLLFYSPEYDVHIIANLGSTDDIEGSFGMLFWIMQYLKEISLAACRVTHQACLQPGIAEGMPAN